MAATIRIDRLKALDVLKARLAKDIEHNLRVEESTRQYDAQMVQYRRDLWKWIKKQPQPSDDDFDTRSFYERGNCACLTMKLDDTAPVKPKREGSKVLVDTQDTEQTIRLLEMSSDETVPLSLSKSLKTLL